MQFWAQPRISDQELTKRLNERLENFKINGDHYDKSNWENLTEHLNTFLSNLGYNNFEVIVNGLYNLKKWHDQGKIRGKIFITESGKQIEFEIIRKDDWQNKSSEKRSLQKIDKNNEKF